jgi:uncharacterized protein
MIPRRPLTAFFLLAYGSSWLLWTPYVLSEGGLGILPFRVNELLGLLPGAYFGPLGAAFLVTWRTEGRPGLHRWAGRLLRWRAGLRWYAIAGLGVPSSLLAATLLLPGALTDLRTPPLTTFLIYLPMLFVQVITTGLAEEPGWRDFAQPRMQARLGPVRGTVLLGVLWSGWHLPLFATGWALGRDVPSIAQFFAIGVLLSIVMTWVFNRTGQSTPLAALVHISNNNALSVLWPAFFPTLPGRSILTVSVIAYGILAVVLLARTRGRLGLPAEPPAATATPSPTSQVDTVHGQAALSRSRGDGPQPDSEQGGR